MKKLLRIRKMIGLLLLFLLMVSGARAQNSCTTSHLDTASVSCAENQYYFSNSNEYWIKFVATSSRINIKIGDSMQQVNPISKIKLFVGACDSLVLIKEDSISFSIADTLIEIGKEYYIQVLKSQTSSSRFDLLLNNVDNDVVPSTEILISSICCGGTIHIRNLTDPAPTTGFYCIEIRPGYYLPAVPCSTFMHEDYYDLTIDGSLCNMFNASNNYTAEITIRYGGCCALYYSLHNITVYPDPTISISPSNPVICPGTSTTLVASGSGTYVWMPGNISGSSIVVNPTVNTTYTVTGTSQYGCTGSATVTVTMDQSLPNVTVNTPTIDCNSCVDLTVSGTNASLSTCIWSTGGTGSTINVCPQGTTQYTVTVYNAGGCNPVVLTSTVFVPPAPAKPELNYYVNNTCGDEPYVYPYEVLDPDPAFSYEWSITTTDQNQSRPKR